MPATGFPGPWIGNTKATMCNFGSWLLGSNTGGNPGTAGAAVPATTIDTINQWVCGGNYFECYNTTASTAAMPLMASLANNGINIDTVTGAAAKTIEITEGNAVSIKNAFASRSVPFFVRATFNINTLANVTELYVGFRKQQTYQATLPAGYTDYATFGVHGAVGLIESQTQLASGGNVVTSGAINAVAGTNFTVQVSVDASGNVSYAADITGNGPLLPISTAAYQFGAGLTLIPYIIYTTVTSHTEVDLVQYTCGLL